MTWQEKANLYLSKNHNLELIDDLLLEIESDPDNISFYSYLGLAYFLSQQDEEAQMSWFTVVTQGNDQDIDELITIIDRKAEELYLHKNHQQCCQLRLIINDINPNLVNNLISLFHSAMELNRHSIRD